MIIIILTYDGRLFYDHVEIPRNVVHHVPMDMSGWRNWLPATEAFWLVSF